MTVGAVGGVGSQVAPASNTQGQSAPKEVAPVGQAESALQGVSNVDSREDAVLGPSFDSMTERMSTKDFVTLSQGVGGIDDSMKTIKDMMKIIMALQLLEKTMEATADIIENVLGKGDNKTNIGDM
tara:strand:- start:2871 stop:3248 length:378 start_codon:yes stop_codon:yes gene_type:complete